MEFKNYTDPVKFREDAFPFLLKNEAANNVLLGVVDRLISEPGFFPRFHLGVLQEKSEVVGACWITPPFGLGISLMPASAIDTVVENVQKWDVPVASILGPCPEAQHLAEKWAKALGKRLTTSMGHGLYVLKKLIPPSHVPGQMHFFEEKDRTLLEKWSVAFTVDCGLPTHEQSAAIRTAESALKNRSRVLWEIKGQPVCMAGASANTPSGVRIGWVYTPPDCRGKGYASALTAAYSQYLLENGKKFCFLFTDTANPTSNGIYRRIGYEQIGESLMCCFG